MGVSTVVGFLLSFMVMLGVFVGIFYVYNENVIKEVQSHVAVTEKLEHEYSGLDFGNYYFNSGRIYIEVKNNGTSPYVFMKKRFCLDLYLDNNYIPKDNFKLLPFYDPRATYKALGKKDGGVLIVRRQNFTQGKIVDCYAASQYFMFNDMWWNQEFRNRKEIMVFNPNNGSVDEYQVPIYFNISNFDFGYPSKELRFVAPLKVFLVLDTTFDTYAEEIRDYSKYDHDVYLGSSILSEVSDPNKVEGVYFNALSFDGVNDYCEVSASPYLQLKDEISIAAWIKWNGSGDLLQNIYTNGGWQNALRVVNDGSINQDKVLFQLSINGTEQYLYSNYTLDNNWHFIVATYDGVYMKIYVDNELVGSKYVIGKIDSLSGDNIIGAESAFGYFFNGTIDELKVFDIALSPDQIKDLYYGIMKYINLSFYVAKWDLEDYKGVVFVKMPVLLPHDNVTIEVYYGNNNAESASNITATFSYRKPRTIGYVLSDRILTTGLNILSLSNNNTIIVGPNQFNLNFQEGSSVLGSTLAINDSVKVKGLAQVNGAGNSDDIIAPISWAGTEFYYSGFRDTGDKFCMIAPWVDANVSIYDAGVLEWNGIVRGNGTCVVNDITSGNALAIVSDYPILVSYYGSSALYDAFVMYPATTDDLYGIPSNNFYVGAGPLGAKGGAFKSDGTYAGFTLSAYGDTSVTSNGVDGTAPGFRVISATGPIGAIQQADSDGTESTVFVPETEMSTLFGAYEGIEYVVLVSPYEDANCTTYDSTGAKVDNIYLGTGTNKVYKYGFDTNDLSYLSAGWYVKCDKPVWGYYEEDVYADETNMIGYLQLRQYTYPSPYALVVS